MTQEDYTRASTDAILGGRIDGRLERWKQSKHQQLSENLADILCDIEKLKSDSEGNISSPQSITDRAEYTMSGSASSAVAQLESLAKQKQTANRYLAAFQLKHNIDRIPFTPKVFENIMILSVLSTFEGLATAAFFYGGGFVSSVSQALVLGLTISGVNVLLSAGLGGFVFGRFWSYGLKSRERDAIVNHKRWAARIGCIFTIGSIIALLLASGIVRATGDTENLSFSLENLAIAASDFHSLMLWGLGIGFSVLAWRKGLSAFTDVYPGFTEAAISVNRVSEQADKVLYDTLDNIDYIGDNAENILEDISNEVNDIKEDLSKDKLDIHHQSENLRQSIVQAEHDFEAYKAEQIAFHQMVTGKQPEGYDRVFFDGNKLQEKIPDKVLDIGMFASKFPMESKAANSQLSISQKSSVKNIHAAYRQFLDLSKG